MGKLIIMRPGEKAELYEHDGTVELEDLYELLECDTVDARSFGLIPDSTRRAHMWFDDNGLLDPLVLPNRRVINGEDAGPVICGIILVCAIEGEDDVALTDAEAEVVLRHVNQWDVLAPISPKPESTMTFYEMTTKGSA